MSSVINPVDKYDLRNVLLNLPSTWICGVGWCVPIEELNKAIDDLKPLDKENLVAYILSDSKMRAEDPEIEDLQTLLTYNEIREYAGMKPLDDGDVFLDAGYIYDKPGMYGDVVLKDEDSMHSKLEV